MSLNRIAAIKAAFMLGAFCMASAGATFQDWLGKDAYVESVTAHWISMPWGISAMLTMLALVLFVAVLLSSPPAPGRRFVVVGRIPGDDDDSASVIEAEDVVEAIAVFKDLLYDARRLDPAAVKARFGEEAYIVQAFELTEAEVVKASCAI